MNRGILVAVAAVIIMITAAYATTPTQGTTSQPDTIHTKVIDSEAGVICYVYEHAAYAGGSIDCLPVDNQSDETISFGDSVTETQLQSGLTRTVYPEQTNVCYTYEHAAYAGGDTSCLDFSETTLN